MQFNRIVSSIDCRNADDAVAFDVDAAAGNAAGIDAGGNRTTSCI